MKLQASRIIVTGASSGIGQALARHLAGAGARLLLVGRRQAALEETLATLAGEGHGLFAGDVTEAGVRQALVDRAQDVLGGLDALVNNAGVSHYGLFAAEDAALMARILETNLLAPMALSRAVLPVLLAQGRGRIVNVGSVFGSIGFACFASYSASKFGLRGFSEALRRELADTGVGVTYVAPRATRTAINSPLAYRMMEALKMRLDTPEAVAAQIAAAMAAGRDEVCLGWPEKLFVRLNGLWPRLVDRALRGQSREMKGIIQAAAQEAEGAPGEG